MQPTMSLHEAARNGDIAELRTRIQAIFKDIVDGSDRRRALGKVDTHQLSAIHYAVKYHNISIVKLLLEKGADVNVLGKNNTTPLHYATRYIKPDGDISLLQLLIYSGADVNAKDSSETTPLHYACSQGNTKVVRELLKAKSINPKAADKLHTIPLHCACTFGSIEIVDLLLEKQVDILSEDGGKMTGIHIACAQGHAKLVDHLFDIVEEQHGISAVSKILNQQNIEGQAPIHLAVSGSHIEVTKYLLERGADLNQPMDGDETVLHVASTIGNKEIVKLMIEHGGEIDKRNEMGRTALHKAAKFGKHKVVDMLIKKGADINIQDNQKETPLILGSSSSGTSRTIQCLLNNGAIVGLRDKEDRTALHMAVQDENVRGVKTIINSSKVTTEIINMKDKDSNSALHIACANGYEEIAILLMAAKADVQSRNNCSQTPLHLAALYGQDDVVDNIIGINTSTINDFDQEGNSALHLAATNGHHEVIKHLLRCGASVNDKNIASLTALDCAAMNGKTEAVKVLIWGGASTQPSKETGLGALHLSSIKGHKETVEELLKHCDIGMTNGNGKNALDLAIDNQNRDAALAILDHQDWKQALRNKTIEDRKVTTPLRKMIGRMPEVATSVLNQCIERSNHSEDDPNYNIRLSYEFLDDIYNDWPSDIVRDDSLEGRGKGELYTKETLQKEMEKKETHIYSYMVHYKRQELLSHPLCRSSIERKWRKFAAYLYYFKLSLYVVFLTFLTGYTLVTAPLRAPYRADDCTIVVENKTWDMVFFVLIGKHMVLILAVIHLVFEVIQMIGQRLDYLAVDNLLEWTVYILAIANVLDDFVDVLPLESVGIICGNYQKSAGAICVFLAWCNFILFIRKFPVVGIYIVMFLYVISTFLKFFIVFIFLILAFGFSFYILLHDEETIPSFDGPISSLVKTGVMMTGEMNFDDIFFSDHNPLIVTWILFILFILIMVIVLMNLLVGLAVDDIQEVQKQAEFEKASMQIAICMDSEKALPSFIRHRFVTAEQVVYPNNPDKIPSNIDKSIILNIRNIVRTDREPNDLLQDGIKSLQKNMISINGRLEDVDEQVAELNGVNDKLNNLEKMMNSLLEYEQQRKRRRSNRSPEKQSKVLHVPVDEYGGDDDEDNDDKGGDDA